ncbi:5'-methylthioadenosine/S-adenosylhomocysteine nucleosidase [Boudabousia liubingyangii]|uniref:5'-methylthioadenosine/S-adenosylhomocysteine nucleosidase n=1 Tax=Boudabousia liubingyangii TaxID=1921764 RepID=UPI0009FAF22A|nr:5'-methylthioadenosine/S-adenosylhomocysteine nucleosidase [Boudabousia liubingyangii]
MSPKDTTPKTEGELESGVAPSANLPAAEKSPISAIVLAAMDPEVQALLDLQDVHRAGRSLSLADPDLKLGPADAWAVALEGASLLVVRTGIGLANAAAATALALNLTNAPLVISSGSAGGLGKDVEVGDVIVSTFSRYGQVDATAFGYELGQVPGQPVKFASPEELVSRAEEAGAIAGQVISNDVFVMSDTVETFRERFPKALATDMETAAAAQISQAMGADFLAIRGISDLCGPRADQENHRDAGVVSAAAAQVIAQVVAG